MNKMAEILQIPPSQFQIKSFSAGDEIKQLLRAQRPTVNRKAIDYHSAALRHIKVNGTKPVKVIIVCVIVG